MTQRRERTEIYNQAANAALLVNGGTAVALLAFLPGIWEKEKFLGVPIACALVLLGLGAFAAALINVFRYYASLRFEQDRTQSHERFAKATLVAHCVSLGAFAGALIVLAAAVWALLPY